MKKVLLSLILMSTLVACQQENVLNNATVDNPKTKVRMKSPQEQAAENSTYRNEFARILSKVVYEREDVRQFLKDEASKEFDRNFDVLYVAVCDELIGNFLYASPLGNLLPRASPSP